MGFYSFQVFAKDIIVFHDPIVQLGPGINVFTASVDDLDAFKQRLTAEGAEIRNVTQLDDHEPVGMESVLLPDELEQYLGRHGKDSKAFTGRGGGEDT